MPNKNILNSVSISLCQITLAILVFVGNWPMTAQGATKCVQEDGSVTYSQFGCKEGANDQESIRSWDSDEKSYRPPDNPDQGQTRERRTIEKKTERRPVEPKDSTDRKPQHGTNSSRHPCNNDGGSVVEQRLAAKACAVLNRTRGKNPEACKHLASGKGLHNASVPEYKLAIKKCQAASGQRTD